MTHNEYAESLRQIADWWEAHPEVPLPYDMSPFRYVATKRDEMTKIAAALGSCEKDYDGGLFYLRKHFGAVQFEAFVAREQVCERKVVGKRRVAKRVIPAHTEDIVEWECFDKPLLAPPSAPLAKAGGAS